MIEYTEITRNQLHDYAVQLMYSFLIMQESGTQIDFQFSISSLLDRPYEECDVYLKEVLIKALKNQAKIIEYVSQYLKNWEFSRLNQAIQAILIIAVTEYYLPEDGIEKPIIINTSVKLARKYGDGGLKDFKFVNAILDNCLDNDRKNLLLD